jgi:hypothetical protein
MNFREKKRYYLALPFIIFVVFCFIFSLANKPKRIHQNESVIQSKECLYANCSFNKVE